MPRKKEHLIGPLRRLCSRLYLCHHSGHEASIATSRSADLHVLYIRWQVISLLCRDLQPSCSLLSFSEALTVPSLLSCKISYCPPALTISNRLLSTWIITDLPASQQNASKIAWPRFAMSSGKRPSPFTPSSRWRGSRRDVALAIAPLVK